MKTLKAGIRYLLLIILLVLIAGFLYWQYHKKHIIKDAVQHTVSKKTDSLYSIGYDSSEIDEVNGNAVFYNVVLQSDSLQRKLLTGNDSLPNVLFNVHVQEIKATGIDVPGFLTNETVSAAAIYINKPVIQIIKTGHEKGFTAADTLALYKKLIGNFTSIRANTIEITNGEIQIKNKDGIVQTSLHNVNINLNNFLVDSTKNYNNIISYFIKDIRLTLSELTFPGRDDVSRISLYNVTYDAGKKIINVDEVKQFTTDSGKVTIDLKKIKIDDLNTDAFVNLHQIKGGSINCDGGFVTIETGIGQSVAKATDPTIEFSGNFFDEAEIRSIHIDNTQFIINMKDKPLILNNVKFNVAEKVNIYNKITLGNLIDNTQWDLSFDALSFTTKNNIYKINAGPFNISHGAGSELRIKTIQLKPLLSEDAYGKLVKQQKDLYNFDFNNITISGINIRDLINEKKLEIEDLFVQPQIRIFNDRTLPEDNSSRQGTFPPESLLKIPKPVFIKNIHIADGSVSYREKSSSSGLTGNVFFNHINGTVSNITNIPEKITENPVCILDTKALFLGKASFKTTWKFMLNTTSGAFSISSTLDSMDAKLLNDLIEPLALMSIKEGHIDKLTFDITGSEAGTSTNEQLLYHDLEINILKKRDDIYKYKKKELSSLIANMVVKNANPEKDNTITITNLPFGRDYHKPFFNVVWNSIYNAAKKTALGKSK